MRVYDLAGLPERLRPQLAAFNPSDGDPPQDFAFIRRLQGMGVPASDYWACYAVEDDQILSRVETLHLPFTGRRGPQTVVGIADVLTRPAGVGRGYARKLLGEVHRREVVQGRTWSFLWTHRTWGAHRLYETLGYMDVYSPEYGVRPRGRLAPRTLPPGYRWSEVDAPEVELLDRLHSESSQDRLGFLPRVPGHARIRIELGWRKRENYRILSGRAGPVGYAYLADESGWNLTANEVVITSRAEAPTILRALLREARGRMLTLQTTSFVRDHEALLRDEGFALYPSSHVVLMGKALGAGRGRAEDLGKCCSAPEFSCHRGDMF